MDKNAAAACLFDFRPFQKSWSASRSYPRGATIFQQGSPADRLYYVERGLLKLTSVESQCRQVIVGLCHRNCLLAAPPVILKARHAATATTLTPCALRSTSGERFLEQLHNDTGLSIEVNKMLSREIQNNLTRLRYFGMDATERLGNFLSDLMNEEDYQGEELSQTLEIPLKNHELAEIMGVSAEHACRLLRKMEDDGLIRRTRCKLVILKPQNIFPVADS